MLRYHGLLPRLGHPLHGKALLEALGLSVRDKSQEGFENLERRVCGGLVQSPGCVRDKAIPDMMWLTLDLQVLWVPSRHQVHLSQISFLGSVVWKL